MHPTFDISTVKVFCTDNKISLNAFYQKLYNLMGEFFGAGESLNYTGEYDSEQLQMGIKVEMEHTVSPMIAERIAQDHLAEMADYYTRLYEMEHAG